MKKSRYSDSQIISILKQAAAGTPVPDLCREHGMSNTSFYKWRAKHTASMSIDNKWTDAIGTGASVLYVGDSFDNASNSRELVGYILVDVRATYQLLESVELYGRIENLFNEKYETTYRYGTTGRAGYIGFRVTL